MQLLLASGAAIDATTSDRWTPLMKVVAVGREDVVGLLTEAGADPDLPDTASASLLHVAEQCEQVGVFLLLAVVKKGRRALELVVVGGGVCRKTAFAAVRTA